MQGLEGGVFDGGAEAAQGDVRRDGGRGDHLQRRGPEAGEDQRQRVRQLDAEEDAQLASRSPASNADPASNRMPDGVGSQVVHDSLEQHGVARLHPLLEDDDRRAALLDLRLAFEVEAEPPLPRAMFLQGLAKSGERNNRGIAYDDLFLKETMPTSRSEKGKIQKGKGIKLFGHYYQNDLFASRELIGQSVPIRYDPFDLGVLYAFVQNQWLPCQSQFYAQLSGRSERELAIITTELRRSAQVDKGSHNLSAARLAAFLEKAEGHQAWLLQRQKDLESHPILDMLAGGPRAAAPSKRSTPVKRSLEERSPVNLADVPIYGEYR